MTDRTNENAALWSECVRYLAGEMSEVEGQAFARRINEDPRATAELEKVRRLWEVSEGLARDWDADRAIVRLKRASIASRPVHKPSPAGHGRRRLAAIVVTGAMAASVVFAIAWKARQGSPSTPRTGIAGVSTSTGSAPPAVARESLFAAPQGQRMVVRLVDGTEVRLAAGSQLALSPEYGRTNRRVWLNGVAHFAVAPSTTLPSLLVLTDDAITRDISTRFLVRHDARTRTTEVVVTDGMVSVSRRETADSLATLDLEAPSISEIVLRTAEVGTISHDGVVSRQPNDDPRRQGWSEGSLRFSDTRLEDVVAEVGTWYGPRLTIDAPALGDLRISGDFDGDTIEQIATLLAASIDARLERRGERFHIRPRRPTP